MSLPTQRRIIQNAWVVPDIEQACLKWVEEMGVGPFFLSLSLTWTSLALSTIVANHLNFV